MYLPENRILLGKQNPSSRNRTVVLFEGDYRKYNNYCDISKVPENRRWQPGEIRNRIFLGDCVKGMEFMPDECVNLIFADPPYFGLGKNFGRGSLKKNNIVSKEEFSAWIESWISECCRILKKDGSIYVCCGWKSSGVTQEVLEKYFTVKNRITWRREKGRGASRNWKENMEDIWFAVKNGEYKFNVNDVKLKKEVIAPYRHGGKNGKPKDWIEKNGKKFRFTYPSNIWTDMVVPFWSMPENTPHPAQKPEKLLERIILASSDKGDIVFDPFLGSGTTAAAAKKSGRNYAGFELNRDFVILALKRLEKSA